MRRRQPHPTAGATARTGTAILVLAMILGACGSRVTDRVNAGVGTAAAGDQFTLPESSGVDGGGESATADGSSAPTGSAGVVVTGGSEAGGPSGPARSGGGASGGSSGSGGGDELTASAPGVTATEIKIGLVYDESAGTLNAAFGFAGIGQVDQRRVYDALIADVNERGGILGRKLVPVYATFDSAGPDAQAGIEVLEQRFCTTFRENRVFVTFYGGQETFTRCMNELGVVRISTDGVDAQLLAESPLLVVLAVNLDRAAGFTVDRLAETDYYRVGKNNEPETKIGLLYYDDPEFQRAAEVLKGRLERRGLEVVSEASVRQPETADQIQDETNSIRAAALKFKSDGVTHVQFISDGRAYMEIVFMQNAEKQLYRPRYGLNSTSGGQALAVLLGSDAQAQLSKSVQVGWFPVFDVHRSEYSGDKTTPAFRRCIELLEEAGERFTDGDPTRNKEAIAAAYCDQFSYLVTAGEATGADLTPESFVQRGVPAVDGLDSAATYILSTAQRRDAYGGVRDARWFDECSCFKYVSPTIHRV